MQILEIRDVHLGKAYLNVHTIQSVLPPDSKSHRARIIVGFHTYRVEESPSEVGAKIMELKNE